MFRGPVICIDLNRWILRCCSARFGRFFAVIGFRLIIVAIFDLVVRTFREELSFDGSNFGFLISFCLRFGWITLSERWFLYAEKRWWIRSVLEALIAEFLVGFAALSRIRLISLIFLPFPIFQGFGKTPDNLGFRCSSLSTIETLIFGKEVHHCYYLGFSAVPGLVVSLESRGFAGFASNSLSIGPIVPFGTVRLPFIIR